MHIKMGFLASLETHEGEAAAFPGGGRCSGRRLMAPAQWLRAAWLAVPASSCTFSAGAKGDSARIEGVTFVSTFTIVKYTVFTPRRNALRDLANLRACGMWYQEPLQNDNSVITHKMDLIILYPVDR